MRGLWLVLTALLAAGCASNLPEPIRQPPDEDIALRAVRQAPERYFGRQVRWGGTIAGIDNQRDTTCVEVVGRELQSSGKPVDDDRSEGRFLACVDRFLDPMVYSTGRLVTAAGTVERVETRPVGDYPYRYPVVRAQHLYLWQPEPDPPRYVNDPFFYDPFWPWPYYRYPRFGPPPFGWYGHPRYFP